MQWQDRGLVLSLRNHGERDGILEVMTRAHGRHLGLVRSGTGPRLRAHLQPGNSLALTWRARLEAHLGQFGVEPLVNRAGLALTSPVALHALSHLTGLLRLLPEREAHAGLHDAAEAMGELLGAPHLLAALIVRFELLFLSELGFGLDLGACAATGAREGLVYVSPKSGRAVSREAGAPFASRLLALPGFLAPGADAQGLDAPPLWSEIEAGFALTGFFLRAEVFAPRNLPEPAARSRLIAQCAQSSMRLEAAE
jgi:DNA repair protein RecO (recombination protein O)